MATTSNIGGAPVPLYDKDGDLVGMWCAETGRAMLGNAFYVVERHDAYALRTSRTTAMEADNGTD